MIARPHSTPLDRIRDLNRAPIQGNQRFVLYWMTATRRSCWNYALDRAVELAEELNKPLVVLEALRCDYPWASDRLHAFALRGMRDNALAFEQAGVYYYPYVEPRRGAGKGLLRELGRSACAVVTDDFPGFFLPRMIEAAGDQLSVRLEAVDSNGLLPLRATDKVYVRAYDLRRYMQRELGLHLVRPPRRDPLAGSKLRSLRRLPAGVTRRWPKAEKGLLFGDPARLAGLPIDHEVAPAELVGGTRAGEEVLQRFLEERLDRYEEDGRHPDLNGTSGLSPYLHFGHVSVHRVLEALQDAAPRSISTSRDPRIASRADLWGLQEPANAFLDQLVTWRELGYQFAAKREDHARYESLPAWAMRSLEEHASDKRPHLYGLDRFEHADTHESLWNAAQNQLRFQGVMHNYLRMLWGKKILHWSESPRHALEIMTELNNKYALDGRDPNSTSGIFWVLGRHDRAWGPEREVFGKVRFMSTANTRRKLRANKYEEFWSGVDRVQ